MIPPNPKSFFVVSLLVMTGVAGLAVAAPSASERLAYNAVTDGATLGAASANWTDDGGLGGDKLLSSNGGAGESLGAAFTAGHVSGNSTFSFGARRSTWDLQANKTCLVVSQFDPAGGDKSLTSIYDLSDPAAAYVTEPATDDEWLLDASFTSGVTLARLIVTGSQGGVSFDVIRIGRSYTDVIPVPATPLHSFAVEQPVTGQSRSGTHAVGQDGDYQVGMAWVEVESGDDVALEIFTNGGERLKALDAPAAQ